MKKNYLFLLFIIISATAIRAQSVNYTALFNNATFSRSLNITLPVGSISGQGGVSTNGSGTYTIPIAVPPGTNEITPSISLDYSSQAGNGLLGRGWNISGLSYISRTTRTVYHDGIAGPVELSLNDKFILDGARLISKTGTYGTNGSTYGTEMENFSTITAKGTYGDGPKSFEVLTKDGVLMEFGNTSNSIVSKPSQGTVLIWALNKIQYPDGNYITFTYINDQTIRIREINYTGNSVTAQVPYNKIKFEYKSRLDANVTHEADLAVGSFVLLDKITVYAESELQIVSSYQLNYGNDDINSYLKEIEKKGSDGTTLNTTIFKYGDLPAQFTAGSSSVIQNVSGDEFTGDLNADGVSDVLSTEKIVVTTNSINYTYHKNFTVYTRTNPAQDNSYSVAGKHILPSNSLIIQKKSIAETSNFIASDYTGDGADDVLTVKTSFSGTQRRLDNIKIYTSVQNPNWSSNGGFPVLFDSTEVALTQNRIHSSGNFIFPGDFNGDGIQDMLTTLGENVSGVYGAQLQLGVYQNTLINNSISITGAAFFPTPSWAVSDQIHVVDFNGDGKSDIMLIKDNNCEIFTIDVGSTPVARRIFFSSSFLTKNDLIYLGDFNGDGKTDFLVRSSLTNNNIPWRRILSTGTDIFGAEFVFTKIPNIVGGQIDEQLAVGDFNGDGKSDIYHGWQVTAGNVNLDVYYSRGLDFKFIRSPFSGSAGYVPAMIADLNGDGRSDVINRRCYCDPFDIFYFKKEGKENQLAKAANGYNHVTEWNYKKLTEAGNFYKRGNLTQHPVNNMQPPMQAVWEFKAQNGIGGYSTTQYSYEEGKLHRTGKGFLGFKKVTADNLSMGIKTVSESEFNMTYYVGLPKKTSTYLSSNNSLIGETTMTNELVSPAPKRFWVKVTGVNKNQALEGRTVIISNIYDSHGNVTQSNVNNNNVEISTTTTAYGAFPGSIPNKPISFSLISSRAGQSGFTTSTTYGYNSIGQQTSKMEFSGQAKTIGYAFSYNSLGNLTSTTITPAGMTARSNSNEYDSRGRYATSSTNVLGQISNTTFDPKWGTPLSITSVDGLTNSTEYDGFGQIRKTTSPEGYSVNRSYGWDQTNGAVWYSFVDHPGKPNVKTWHDVIGREIKTETEGFNGGVTTQLKSYDARGNLYTSTQPYKAGEAILITTSTYDEYNRSKSSGNPVFGTSNNSYSYAGGNLTTTTTNPANQISSKVTDASGQTISATDMTGTLSYFYSSHGNLITVTAGSHVITTSQYDEYGRRTNLTDMNAGTTSYVTNALGEITNERNAKNQTHSMSYDLLGRIITRSGPEGTTSYEYYASGTGASINRIKKITGFSGNIEEFTYDSYGRQSTVKETVDGVAHTTTYGYNMYGDITSIAYPSGFGTNHAYDANGYPTTIKNSNNSITFFTNAGMSGLGKNTAYTLGNTKSSTTTYYYGMPTQYLTTGVQNLEMGWNYATGNLTMRKDNIKSKIESFINDGLNRLQTSTVTGQTAVNVNYEASGNIASKTDVGTYTYHATKQNAVIGVTNPHATIPLLQQDITYNAFKQPEKITENGYELTYTYGGDYERVKGVLKQNGNLINTRYYFDNYEKDISAGSTKYIQYIGSPAGQIAIVVSEGGAHTAHYTYTDHLGSILTVTDGSGTVEKEQSFDAWGRRRDPANWTLLPPTAGTILPNWLYRGYTGHEHMDNFGLINMNGRLYDPVIARMLSPDNYVPEALSIQGYNRYSYALNNPLVNTDPNGQFVVAAIFGGALVGSFIGMISASIKGQHELSGAWKGGIVGGVGGLFGAFAPIGILPGLGYGAATGAVTGGLNAAIWGKNIERGAFSGAILGGVTGGIIGGIEAHDLGANIWTGYRAPQFMPSTYSTAATVDPSIHNMEYVNKFKEINYPDISVNRMSISKMPAKGWSHSNGNFVSSDGKDVALAITEFATWKHGHATTIYFARNAFASKEQFAVVMAHELGHVVFKSLGLSAWADEASGVPNRLLDTEGHLAIHQMTYDLIQKNGWNFNLISNQVTDFRFGGYQDGLYQPIKGLIRKITFP